MIFALLDQQVFSEWGLSVVGTKTENHSLAISLIPKLNSTLLNFRLLLSVSSSRSSNVRLA